MLAILTTGEPHDARSAPIADCLPLSVISTPSACSGAWPVVRLVFNARCRPAFSASATSHVAPRGVLAFDATVMGVSEIVRRRHMFPGNKQPLSSADERRTEPLFLSARGECRAQIECTRWNVAINDFVRQRSECDAKHASVLRLCCAAFEGQRFVESDDFRSARRIFGGIGAFGNFLRRAERRVSGDGESWGPFEMWRITCLSAFDFSARFRD